LQSHVYDMITIFNFDELI